MAIRAAPVTLESLPPELLRAIAGYTDDIRDAGKQALLL